MENNKPENVVDVKKIEPGKIEIFIRKIQLKLSNWKNKVINPYNRFRTLLGNLEQYNLLEERTPTVLNPYQMLSGWLLDIITNGILIAVLLNSFTGWKGVKNLYLIPSLGIAWYLIIDFVKEISKAIKGE